MVVTLRFRVLAPAEMCRTNVVDGVFPCVPFPSAVGYGVMQHRWRVQRACIIMQRLNSILDHLKWHAGTSSANCTQQWT